MCSAFFISQEGIILKKKTKNEFWNLIFSAFLIAAFLLCSYFFIGIVNESFAHDQPKKIFFTGVIFIVFGLILFYATRVGDGKQVWRFSLAALLLMVLPSLYVIIASVAEGLPFHSQISSRSEIVNVAAVIFGYGIPYTFLSGFEMTPEKAALTNNGTSSADRPADTEDIEESQRPEEFVPAEEPEDIFQSEEAEYANEPSDAEVSAETADEEYDLDNFS